MSGRTPRLAPLALAALMAVAAAPAPRDSVVRGTIAMPRPAGGPGARVLAMPPGTGVPPGSASGDTAWLEPQEPSPAAAYGSFAAAADSLRALVRRTLGAYADSATFARGPTAFLYRDKLEVGRSTRGTCFWMVSERDSEVRVPGLRMTLATHTESAPGYAEIQGAMTAAGWAEQPYYEADGPDGTMFAMVCREALCVIEAQWEGGDDEDTTAVGAPGQTLRLTCVPRSRPLRPPGRGR